MDEIERVEMERAHKMKQSEALIDAFCKRIKDTYRANVPQKGNSWMSSTPGFLFRRLKEERAELDKLMDYRLCTKGILSKESAERLTDHIRKEILDEANLLWMLAEKL